MGTANSGRKRAVVCVETGVMYPSASVAARSAGVKPQTLTVALRKAGRKCKGHTYRYADARQEALPCR